MSDSPQPPLTELAAAAVAMHEMFRAYVDAGFSEDQALRIVIGVVTGMGNAS